MHSGRLFQWEGRPYSFPLAPSGMTLPRQTGMKIISCLLVISVAVVGCAQSDSPEEIPPAVAEPTVAQPGSPNSPDAAESSADTLGGEWTTDPVTSESSPDGVVTLTEVRTAEHPDFDRFVVQLDGAGLPGYSLGYVEGASRCGSGEPVDLDGGAMLVLRLEPARAHDDLGNPTVAARSWDLAMPSITEAALICDFEAVTEFALGVVQEERYRLTTLTDPTRIVLDIRH